jgi:uncharacterized protein YlaI
MSVLSLSREPRRTYKAAVEGHSSAIPRGHPLTSLFGPATDTFPFSPASRLSVAELIPVRDRLRVPGLWHGAFTRYNHVMSWYRSNYLKSDDWRNLRAAVIHRFAPGGRCFICKEVKKLDGHHLRYRKLVDVRPWEVIPICRDCHDAVHVLLELRPHIKKLGIQTHKTVLKILAGPISYTCERLMMQLSRFEKHPRKSIHATSLAGAIDSVFARLDYEDQKIKQKSA